MIYGNMGNDNIIDYREMAHDARRALEGERDELMERAEQLDAHLRVLDSIDTVLKENSQLKDDNDNLQQQLADERQQRAELEMKMNEMSKLSAGMAKKASQNDLEKALRIFLNTSKRKTMSKREAAKTVIMELLSSAKIEISDDVLELLDHLDDEQPDTKVVNVQGDYNDIHENGEVKMEV